MAKYKYFKKATLHTNGDVTLTAKQFHLLALIDENKEIGLIARESGMDITEFKEYLVKLYEMGLIIPVTKKTIQRYSVDFFQAITTSLTYYVGPVAKIIMTDILSDMNIEDKKIPVDDLEKLIFKIMDEISDPNQKIEFNNEVEKILSRTR